MQNSSAHIRRINLCLGTGKKGKALPSSQHPMANANSRNTLCMMSSDRQFITRKAEPGCSYMSFVPPRIIFGARTTHAEFSTTGDLQLFLALPRPSAPQRSNRSLTIDISFLPSLRQLFLQILTRKCSTPRNLAFLAQRVYQNAHLFILDETGSYASIAPYSAFWDRETNAFNLFSMPLTQARSPP